MTHSNSKPTSVPPQSICSQFATYRKALLRAPYITRTLAFCFILFFGFSGLRAQVFLSNSEYNFRQQQVTDGQAYNSNGDPIPVLSMSCLAANGYGQWTLSTTPGTSSDGTTGAAEFPFGWYLLANGLYAPCVGDESTTAHPQCIPPGVVQCGTLPGLAPSPTPAQTKAVANLDGMVAFISVQSGGTGFVQSGFTAADVDLSLSFLSNPAPGSTPGAGTMNILPDPSPGTSATPHSWPNIPVGSNTVASYGGPGDWRNEFDVCADASFIYIIWETLNSGVKELWVTVVPIGSAMAVTGFPMQISTSSGENPTITCDPRNNRGGGTTPAFDVAFINPQANRIKVGSWSGSGWTYAPTALSQNYWNPTTGPNATPPSTATTESYAYPMEARIIRNSIYNAFTGTSTSYLAVYAEVCNETPTVNAAGGYDGWLIFYPPTTSTFGTANYVAGAEMPAPKLEGQIVPMSTPNPPVWTNCITAFADPYDNQSGWPSMDEFHCLYQYDLAATSQLPLCIVRGSDVDAGCPTQPDALTDDTRLVLNQTGVTSLIPTSILEDNPSGDNGSTINSEYVAAVNQMGIHVHWRTLAGVHFYARDMNRTFDEAIDENTLVTDQCIAMNGTAHGGTEGAEVLDNIHMAIWTDGNYGADFSDHTGDLGLWQPGTIFPVGGSLDPHVGTLNFIGENSVLQIGGMGNWDGGADLTDMPYFYCNFDGSQGQGITVGPGSTFDYNGLIANHNTNGSIVNGAGAEPKIGSPFVEGQTDPIQFGAGIITLHGYYYLDDDGHVDYNPATLNIHGGADFGINEGGELQSVYEGNIQMLFDGNVYPLPPATPSPVTGHATLHGTTVIEESTVEGHIPADNVGTIITIEGFDPVSEPRIQFLSGSTIYANQSSHGVSEIQINPELQSVNTVEFDTDDFEAARIHDIDPENDDPLSSSGLGQLTVDNSDFNYQHGRSIFVESRENPIGGDAAVITINNNNFGSIDTHDLITDSDEPAFGTFGVYIKGLDANFNGKTPGLVGTILVDDNKFEGNYWNNVNPNYPGTPNIQFSAAICFENTTGNIRNNTITDPAYNKGIWLRATIPSTGTFTAPPTTNTLMCNNTIKHLHLPDESWLTNTSLTKLNGIFAQFHTGNVYANFISDCDVAYMGNGALASMTPSTFQWNIFDNTFDPSGSYLLSNAIGITGLISSYILDFSDFFPVVACLNDVFATPGPENNAAVTMDENSFINLGSNFGGEGLNNIEMFTGLSSSTFQPTTGDALILQGTTSGTPSALGNIDGNFWNTGVDPHNGDGGPGDQNWIASSSVVNATNITYNQSETSGTLSDPASVPSPGLVGCAGGTTAHTKKSGKMTPQSILLDSSDSPCMFMFDSIRSYAGNNKWTEAYDSTQYFVENCYTNQYAAGAMGSADNLVQNGALGAAPGCWEQNLQWLLSVLPLRQDAQWFCADVFAIMGSLDDEPDTNYQQRNTEGNRGMSVLNWLIHNPACNNSGLDQLYLNSRGSQISTWLDTQDTDSVKLDTTIYTMQQLGLDSVLKYAGLLSVSNNTPSIISNATAYPNPTGEGTVISFGIAREAYVSITLYDVLGHQVSTAGFGGVVEPGNLSVPMSLQGLPAGTYFARIQTTYGEAQTVKLVKE